MSAAVTPIPENPLCDSAHPADVLSRARAVLKFIHVADDLKDPDGLKDDTEYQDGRQYVWGMLYDALGFAERKVEHFPRGGES